MQRSEECRRKAEKAILISRRSGSGWLKHGKEPAEESGSNRIQPSQDLARRRPMRSDDYRKHAEQCEALAAYATPRYRPQLLKRAEMWRALADVLATNESTQENRTVELTSA
jgi:hypothetical protein